MAPGGSSCPRCGRAATPNDRFCRFCGQGLLLSMPSEGRIPSPPPEETLAVVPGVTINVLEGSRDGSILLTDRRTIFVLEKASATNIAFLLGGALGAGLFDAMATKKQVDYAHITPDQLAADPNNLVIPHAVLHSLEVKGGLADLKLLLGYRMADGTMKRLKAAVSPPPELLKQRRIQGVKQRDAVEEYGRTLRGLYQRALHPS